MEYAVFLSHNYTPRKLQPLVAEIC